MTSALTLKSLASGIEPTTVINKLHILRKAQQISNMDLVGIYAKDIKVTSALISIVAYL